MKKLGFGCMRLPMAGDRVDLEQFAEMTDRFLARGFTYFDTAHGYLNGQSETAIRECLASRYPRDAYQLTNKLSSHFVQKTEDIRPLFEGQLTACGVDYFDYYLMHAQDASVYAKYKRLGCYETAYRFKKEGLIRHFGISFHDRAAVLDQILTEHPEVEAVQIQFNYLDYDDPSVESRKCYEVCAKHQKPVIVMEPIKGGSLVHLPPEAQTILDALGGGSAASYAVRFAAGFDNIFMVLSGMHSLSDLDDNTGYMRDFQPLNEVERAAIAKVVSVFRGMDLIPCTGCRYCLEECVKELPIPELFALMNKKKQFGNWNTDYYYSIRTANGKKASDCLGCGRCEVACPQHLAIRDLLRQVAKEFEH